MYRTSINSFELGLVVLLRMYSGVPEPSGCNHLRGYQILGNNFEACAESDVVAKTQFAISTF